MAKRRPHRPTTERRKPRIYDRRTNIRYTLTWLGMVIAEGL